MLEEKKMQYGGTGGFYETNNENYTHALGETILKIKEFGKTNTKRLLVKAMTWLYLIYEQETQRGPR